MPTLGASTVPTWVTASVTITQGSALVAVANTLEYMILGKIAWVRGYAQPASGQAGTGGQPVIIGLPAALTMVAAPGGLVGTGFNQDEYRGYDMVVWTSSSATTISPRRYNDYQAVGVSPAYVFNGNENDTMSFDLVLHLA